MHCIAVQCSAKFCSLCTGMQVDRLQSMLLVTCSLGSRTFASAVSSCAVDGALGSHFEVHACGHKPP